MTITMEALLYKTIGQQLPQRKNNGSSQNSFADTINKTSRSTSYFGAGKVYVPDTGRNIQSGYEMRTYYTDKGIVCRYNGYDSKEGVMKSWTDWEIPFENAADRERVERFLTRIPEDDHSVFTTREQFWRDFLDGKVDEDSFMEYYSTLDNGTANFIHSDGDGKSHIDKQMMDSPYFWYFGLQKVGVYNPSTSQGKEITTKALVRQVEIKDEISSGYDNNELDAMKLVACDINGIRCVKHGQTEPEWEIPFTDESHYWRVNNYLESLTKSTALGYLGNKSFWEKFLA